MVKLPHYFSNELVNIITLVMNLSNEILLP